MGQIMGHYGPLWAIMGHYGPLWAIMGQIMGHYGLKHFVDTLELRSRIRGTS